MKQNGSRTQIYDAADLWVDAALRHDDSLFTPGQAIWSPTVLADLYERFVENPDESREKSFEQKFEEQLSGAAPETFQLAGELLFVHFLVADDMSGQHKRAVISRVLEWSSEPVAIPERPEPEISHEEVMEIFEALADIKSNTMDILAILEAEDDDEP